MILLHPRIGAVGSGFLRLWRLQIVRREFAVYSTRMNGWRIGNWYINWIRRNTLRRFLSWFEGLVIDAFGPLLSASLLLALAFVALLGVAACVAVLVFIRWMLS